MKNVVGLKIITSATEKILLCYFTIFICNISKNKVCCKMMQENQTELITHPWKEGAVNVFY